MGNKEWDKYLNDLLGDFKPEGNQPNWDEFSNHLDGDQDLNKSDDPSFDENLKESFETYQAPGQVAGWQRIQASLDAQDKQFDEDIRKRVANFEPHYDPRTWPLFLQRLADNRFLGAKLIALKIAEVAAVLLFLFTVVNMGRMGKLPFDTPLYIKSSDQLDNVPGSKDMADLPSQQSAIENLENADNLSDNQNDVRSKNYQASFLNTGNNNSKTNNSIPKSSKVTKTKDSGISDDVTRDNYLTYSEITPLTKTESSQPIGTRENENTILLSDDVNETSVDPYQIASADERTSTNVADYLATMTTSVTSSEREVYIHPTYIRQHHKAHTSFGILAQVDYNRLRMPEDRLYSAGRQIIFPQQGIPSYGYGGGFTIAAEHPRWAIESGLIYSSKNFEPGRKLAVGTEFDNGIVEFEAMRLQLVTMPVQFRYKVDHNGPFKFYALAGFGLNLIVQSNIDVLIKYHFASLSANANPNNDPNLANTIKETRRIKEHIRDGAPFSTKSFLSATAGLGIEYSINEHKTFFLQSAIQYQIPDLEFSNNNGKHIRSLSVQAGVRTPLGN
jgi:hypothetical protein